MYFRNKNILIISPEEWGINYLSKNHYAIELIKRKNKVVFLNPPKRKLINYEINKNVNLDNLLIINCPFSYRGINRIPYKVRKLFQLKESKKLLKFLGTKFDVVWSFDPFRFQDLGVFQANLNIYHPVDVHKSKVERNIANSADVILATSDKILEKIDPLNTPKFKINHGLAEHFVQYNGSIMNSENKNPNEIPKNDKIKVGYVGNLLYKYLDVKILRTIIKENQKVDFYFIGPYQISNLMTEERNIDFIKFLKESKNVHLMGSKPSNDLPSYLYQFDILLLCYTGDRNVAEMANPHKLLEYLSSGKTVICHYIDEYNNKRDLVEMVDDNKLMPRRFTTIIENLQFYNTPDKSKMRIKYATENSYSRQMKKINKIIKRLNFENINIR